MASRGQMLPYTQIFKEVVQEENQNPIGTRISQSTFLDLIKYTIQSPDLIYKYNQQASTPNPNEYFIRYFPSVRLSVKLKIEFLEDEGDVKEVEILESSVSESIVQDVISNKYKYIVKYRKTDEYTYTGLYF